MTYDEYVERYRTHEGVIVGRKLLPGGDVILRLVGPEGSVDVIARKAQRPSGRSGRLMLFHHIRYQAYHKPDRDLATLTQAELVGRLEKLSHPNRYPPAAYLAELAYRLAAPEVAEPIWNIFISGLRGIANHPEPGVPLVWSGWRLLAAAGLAPRLTSRCGHNPIFLELEGSLACEICALDPAYPLGPSGVELLAAVLRRPGKEAVVFLEKKGWRSLLQALVRYVAYQLEPLRSESSLRNFLSK